MNFPLFIARRIFGEGDDGRMVSRPAVSIATAGVAIGLAVMIVSVCVVFGFKHTIRDKVAGFGGHIQVGEFMSLHSGEGNPIQINDSMMHVLEGATGVRHVQRFAMRQGILKTNEDFLGVMFKGVGPEFDSTFIHQNMITGAIPCFSDSSSSNQVLISQDIANKLRVTVGQRVFAYFIDDGVRVRRFTVSGIYETNLSQYDKVICFIDLHTAVRLNGWKSDQVSGAEITVQDFSRIEETADIYINKVNRSMDAYGETYTSRTIAELNPQIFSWLDLLDLNVWIILALMMAVAGVTVISGLLIIILERTTMIGILKALGARNTTIRHTFLWFSVFMIGRGLLAGNIIGIGLVLLQRYTGLIHLDPQTYYVSVVPVELNLPLIVLLNIGTLVISIFVLIAPSYLISHIDPAKSMRYE